MRAMNGSKRNEKRLRFGSDTDDRSLLFRTSNDSMTSILSYLGMRNICLIDIAVSNTAERVIWLTCLSANYLAIFSEYEHCKDSLRWLVKRGIRLESLKIRDKRCRETERINGSTLLGLDMSSLRCINLSGCSIGDEEVSLMAHGCPLLSAICLSGCERITDASCITLGRCCRQLISIDIERCKNITDKGLEGCPPSSKFNLSYCEKITDMGISALAQSCSALSCINLSNCKKITDMGISAIARCCPLLSNIDLSDCEKITDTGVSALASGCPLLDIINLTDCN